MHSFLCAFPTFHGSCKYARREKLCIVPSIVFCTGKVPFLYKTYAILMHTRYHCGAKVCVWRTAAETCTDKWEMQGESHFFKNMALSCSLPVVQHSAAFEGAALRCMIFKKISPKAFFCLLTYHLFMLVLKGLRSGGPRYLSECVISNRGGRKLHTGLTRRGTETEPISALCAYFRYATPASRPHL